MEKKKYENLWLNMNHGKINKVLYELEEYRFKSHERGSFDAFTTMTMIKGLTNEIEKLEKQNRELKEKIKSSESLENVKPDANPV